MGELKFTKKLEREVRASIKRLEKQAEELLGQDGEVLFTKRDDYAGLIQALADEREFLKLVRSKLAEQRRAK